MKAKKSGQYFQLAFEIVNGINSTKYFGFEFSSKFCILFCNSLNSQSFDGLLNSCIG